MTQNIYSIYGRFFLLDEMIYTQNIDILIPNGIKIFISNLIAKKIGSGEPIAILGHKV
jgi:hypothetical protein